MKETFKTPSALRPDVHGLFDPATWTVAYLVHNGPGSACAIIDPVFDFDPKSGRTQHTAADWVIDSVRSHDLSVQWILETHAHADHLSAAPCLRAQLGDKIGIGSRITTVQKVFKGVFNLAPGFQQDGSRFDHLLQEGDAIALGALTGEVMFVPGHTPGRALDASTRKLLSMPPQTRLFMSHDYPPTDRPMAFETTVAEHRAKNIHVHDGGSEDAFVAMRTKRDATLEMPTLILPSVQDNIRAGELPPTEDNGVACLKIPLNAL